MTDQEKRMVSFQSDLRKLLKHYKISLHKYTEYMAGGDYEDMMYFTIDNDVWWVDDVKWIIEKAAK